MRAVLGHLYQIRLQIALNVTHRNLEKRNGGKFEVLIGVQTLEPVITVSRSELVGCSVIPGSICLSDNDFRRAPGGQVSVLMKPLA